MRIGVLALQGAVSEHISIIRKLGTEAVEIKEVKQLLDIDGLILPGGESTTIGKLLREYNFVEAINLFFERGKPIFGTCAGLIILAKSIVGQTNTHCNLMDITVERNAFGRQKESFETLLTFEGIVGTIKAVFIRAPLIVGARTNVEVLSMFNGQIVAAKQENLLVTSFHPELTDELKIHQYFLSMVKNKINSVIV